ncbi:MAG: helix-turn-helix transcriptional regulator [Candidatus Eremiobacteraeota bacterium]|nr:helix-turn-helix transcriptional regulator [Candidatus Eremiobacteraeota bacterium]
MLQNPLVSETLLAANIEHGNENPCTYLALVVIDARAQIQFSFWNAVEGEELKTLLCGDGAPLRPELESLVTELIFDRRLSNFDSCVVFRDGGRTLRLSPLAGAGVEGTLFALVMEADRHDGTLARAASRYRLTRRQTEVLALVLEGASANDVAHSLVISEYTAQGYIKSLLAKTNSRNRAAMVARVLNWNEPATARPSREERPPAYKQQR